MGCCSGKGACNRKADVEPATPAAQELFSSLPALGMDAISKLQEIATAGLRAGTILRQMLLNLDIKNTSLQQLAKQISDLAVENAYLKSVLKLFSPADFRVTNSSFEICFGPDNKYNLTIPVTHKNSRAQIAKQLRAAADKLEAELKPQDVAVHPNQTLFPFAAEVK